MNYKNMTPRELALTLSYAAEVNCVDPDLVMEAATRIHPDVTNPQKQRDERWMMKLLDEMPKIRCIKAYREETGCSLRDAKDYIDRLEMHARTVIRNSPSATS
jgi:ribosomal protein L7/L12